MPRTTAPPDGAPPRADQPVDARRDTAGSPAPVSASLAAQVETLPALERRVLHCLGAAVVLGWNQLPTEVQRTLFRQASTGGDADAASDLPARIARFLHDHKDDGGRP